MKSFERDSLEAQADKITAMMIENLNRNGKLYPPVVVPDVPPLSGDAERARKSAMANGGASPDA